LCLGLLLAANRAEITLLNEVHQVHIIVGFELFLLVVGVSLEWVCILRRRVKLVQNRAIEVVLLIAVVLFVFLIGAFCSAASTLKLITVHASAHLLRGVAAFLLVVGLDDGSERVDQALLRIVELRKLDRKVERVDELVGFCLDPLGQVHEVLVHHEGLLGLVIA